ncbi:hypothetical protein U1Q18_005078 [Sarracenia purpurea var. burkii]
MWLGLALKRACAGPIDATTSWSLCVTLVSAVSGVAAKVPHPQLVYGTGVNGLVGHGTGVHMEDSDPNWCAHWKATLLIWVLVMECSSVWAYCFSSISYQPGMWLSLGILFLQHHLSTRNVLLMH